MATLAHKDGEAVCKPFWGCVEIAEHFLAPPPPNYPDHVRVDACREEQHCPPHLEGARANILWRESNGRSGCSYHGADGCRNLGAAYGDSLVLVAHRSERNCSGGAVASKVCDAAMQCCHQTALRMAGLDVANGFPLDTIFLCGE